MKKILSIILSLALLIQGTYIVIAENAGVTISVAEKAIEKGDGTETVEVPISVEGNTGILGMTLQVTYDEGLTLTGVAKGDALTSLAFTKPGDFSANPVNLVWDGEADADTSNGSVAVLTFTVSKSIAKDYAIEVATKGVFDDMLDNVEVTTVNGKISVIGEEEPEVTPEPEEPTQDIPDENLILSSTTTVNVANTENCFAKVTDNEKAGGNYSLHFKATGSDWLEVSQNLTEGVTAGEKYIISVAVKPVSGRVWFRIGWDDDGWVASHQTQLATDLGNGWIKLTKEVTLKADQTKLLFHNDGAAEMYIDDISLVPVDGTENLVPDGGFEEVTVSGGGTPTPTPTPDPEPTPTPTPTPTPDVPEEDIPDENLTLSNTTTVNVANTETCFAKVTDNEKAGGRYSLHVKAGAADWLEVSQHLTEGATAGGKYLLSASVKVVSGKVWFRVGWDDTAWLVSNQTELGTDLGNGWIRLVKEVKMTADQPNFLFHNDGEAEMYVDDISLVAVGGTENLVPDGGFEDVTISDGTEPTPTPEVTPTPTPEPEDPEPTPTPDPSNVPDDYLTLSGTTIVNVDNSDTLFAKVTDDEKASGSYSLHVKAGADDWLEVAQNLTETATAGGKYILSVAVKAVSGKVWFRVGWDDTGWLVSNQTDLGTDLGNGWIRIVKEVTLTGDQTKLLFHNDGAAELYIDDLVLIPMDGTENLVPDGGFDEVTVYTPDPDDFEDYEMSNLILKKGTDVIDGLTGAGSYTVLVNVKNNKLTDGLPCELLVAVFNQNGEMENLYSDKDNFEMTALGANAEDLSVTFNIGEGYSVEAYLINNRQDIDLYTLDGENILELWTQSAE